MKVAIVGAGFSGIGMAASLQRAGHEYAIFERADDLGGVWQHNTYPGAACDVPSYLYSFSWAQRRDWVQPCSPQAEIKEYLRDVARASGVIDRIRLGTEVTEARWDGGALRWTLTTATGESYECDALVLACGQLTRPAWPRIAGMEEFAGRAFHSAQWDHDYDLTGKRVAVVGTGASAIQFVPEIAERVARLDVYQRTAPWMLPRRNVQYREPVRAAIRSVPGIQTLRRYGLWAFLEAFILAYTKVPALKALLRLWSMTFMWLHVRDRALRRRLWPDYAFGCKRVLFSSNYLPALQRPNVEVITTPIARIAPDGIIVSGGQKREVDAIIWSTGFHADRFVIPMRVIGSDGVELQDAWDEGAEAHLGITVSGYPNMFLLYGPNTNLGVGSIIAMLEAQIRYVEGALKLIEGLAGRALDVREEVQRRSVADVQERLQGSLWTQCDSWYRQNGVGRVTSNWPGFMLEYMRDTRHVDAAQFRVLEPAG